jgi:predicted transposase YbfD/YdcC
VAPVRFTSHNALLSFADSDLRPARATVIEQLSHPALTGLTQRELHDLTRQLAPLQAARAERRGYQRRSGPRQPNTRGGVFHQKISNGERVLLAILYQRHLCTMDVLASLLGVCRSSIGNAIRETLPLLDQAGHLPAPAPARYRTSGDLMAATASSPDSTSFDAASSFFTASMHAQRSHATYLAGRGAHYVLTVKRNQPGLFAQLAALPWCQVPVAHHSRERGHGRAEQRTLKVTAVAAGLAFPHAAQAIQVVRRRRSRGTKKCSRETVYAITSLTATQASPAGLAAIIRGRWMIEDRLHWVRDMDFDEDRSQARTASAPQVMAALRNLAITIPRLAGHASIATRTSPPRRPDQPLQTIMNC